MQTDPIDQWYLDVQGKKYGPYTWAQVQSLYKKRQIIAEDKITSAKMQGKWQTLREFLLENPAPLSAIDSTPSGSSHGSPKAVPPRPDEKSMTGLLSPKYAVKAAEGSPEDPIVELFDVYQAAHERKPSKPTSPIHRPQVVGTLDSGDSGVSTLGLRLFVIVSVGVAIALSVRALVNKQEYSPPARVDHSANNTAHPTDALPTQSTDHHAAMQPPSQAPAQTSGQSQTSSAAQTPVSQPPPAQQINRPRVSLARPSLSNAARDAERERELEKDREAERERELERERERERDNPGPMDIDRQNEDRSENPPSSATMAQPAPPGSPGTPGSLPADYRPYGN